MFLFPKGQKHEHINRTHLKSNGTGSGYGKRKKNQNNNNSTANNSNNNNNVNNQQSNSNNTQQSNQQNNQQQNNTQTTTTTHSTSNNNNIVTVTTADNTSSIVSGQIVTGSLNAISAVIGSSSQVNSSGVQTHLSLPPGKIQSICISKFREINFSFFYVNSR